MGDAKSCLYCFDERQDILRSSESRLSIAAAADESYDEWHRDGIKEGMDAGARKRAHGFRR